jgi:hypothetical protein
MPAHPCPTGMGGHIRFIVERNTENPARHGISSGKDKGAWLRPVGTGLAKVGLPVRPLWALIGTLMSL